MFTRVDRPRFKVLKGGLAGFLPVGITLWLLLASVAGASPSRPAAALEQGGLTWQDQHLDGKAVNVSVGDLLEQISRLAGFRLVIKSRSDPLIDIAFDHLTLDESIKKLGRLASLNYTVVWKSGTTDRIEKLVIYPGGENQPRRYHRPSSRRNRKTRPTASPARRILDKSPLPPAPPPPEESQVPDTPEKQSTGPLQAPDLVAPEMHAPDAAEQVPGEILKQPVSEAEDALERSAPQTSASDPEAGSPPTVEKKVAFEGSMKEMGAFLDKLANEKRIDPDQYQAIIEKMEERK